MCLVVTKRHPRELLQRYDGITAYKVLVRYPNDRWPEKMAGWRTPYQTTPVNSRYLTADRAPEWDGNELHGGAIHCCRMLHQVGGIFHGCWDYRFAVFEVIGGRCIALNETEIAFDSVEFIRRIA